MIRRTLLLRSNICPEYSSTTFRLSCRRVCSARSSGVGIARRSRLFRAIDRDLWEETGHNPRLMLGRINQKRLEELETDEAFLAQMDGAHAHANRA